MHVNKKASLLHLWTLAALFFSPPLLWGEKPQQIEQPDTPAGRCAFAYIEAFNSGDKDRMGAFWRKYAAASGTTLKIRIEEYEKYHGMAGTLTPLRLVHSSKCLISVQTRCEKEGAYWFLDFHLSSAPAYGLASSSLTGPIHGEVREGELLHYVAADDLLRRKIIDKISKLLKAE